MAATDSRIDLRLWSVATFRTVTFVVAVALTLHLRGSLREDLASLDTIAGATLFGLLWATTVGASCFERALLRRNESDPRRGGGRIEATMTAGALNGAAFFVALALVFVVSNSAGKSNPGMIFPRLGAFVVVAVMGSSVAFVTGGFVGLAYGLLESTMGLLASRILRATLSLPRTASRLPARAAREDRP